tara:strand:- start:5526 stop:5984 length:459 start_codon:yes stop_codon:yes gene_type:complete
MFELKIDRGEIYCSVQLYKKSDEVFDFFSNANNLEILTPSFLKFKILSELPEKIKLNDKIDYRLSLRNIPIKWRSEITAWEPHNRFVDEQVLGPYRKWVHEHLFVDNEEGCLAIDKVEYQVWFGFIVDKLFVKKELERIFSFRSKKLIDLFN